jgi:hypothetical protein
MELPSVTWLHHNPPEAGGHRQDLVPALSGGGMESRPGRRRDGCLRTTHFLREKRRFQQAFQVDLPLLRLATSSEAAIHQQHIARQFSSSEEKRQGMHGRPGRPTVAAACSLFGGGDSSATHRPSIFLF